MIAFAMNLILTTWISFALISTVEEKPRSDWSTLAQVRRAYLAFAALRRSGMVMMPPLVLWLTGYVAWGWWSGHDPSDAGRAIGVGLLMACSAIVSLYLCNYVSPIHHPPAPSSRRRLYNA